MNAQSLQEHMQANIGVFITDPVIDGCWHSGSGKLSKVSYVGHYLAKGLLVRYRTHAHGQGDICHVWKEWGQGDKTVISTELESNPNLNQPAIQQASEEEKTHLLTLLVNLFDAAIPATHEHPYIERKKILALGAKQLLKRCEIKPATAKAKAQYITPNDLIIPVYSPTGALQGVQQITTTGQKLTRGTVRNGHLWLGGGLTTGEEPNRLYIAEGWATGVAVHMRTRNPVVVAFSTNNLLNCGKWAREQYPNADIIFAVDNDEKTITRKGQTGKAGILYAEEAAKAVNGGLLVPPILGDWCDWHISQIEAEKKARPAETESGFEIKESS